MGKTLFLKKYEFLSTEEETVIYFSLQGIKDIGELIDLLIHQLRSEQSNKLVKIAFDKIRKVYNSIKPTEVNIDDISFKLPEFKSKWKDALAACFLDIANRNKEKDSALIIILDELPIMVWDWINNDNAEQAIQFLDILRKQRQTLEDIGKVRFVICGSIGMNVVLEKLKREHQYTGEPFNDAAVFSLDAMTITDANSYLSV